MRKDKQLRDRSENEFGMIRVKERWPELEEAVVWIIYHTWIDGVSEMGGLLDGEMRLSKIERSGMI